MTTYTYDAANRLATQNGQSVFTWDANGNLLQDGSTVYAYDFANRLISTTLSGVNTQFGYNGDGIRLRLIEAGTLTTYTQDYAAPLPVVLQAKTSTGSTQYMYSLGTRPLAEYEAAAWEHLLPDPLGSVRQIADASGSVTLLKSYEPYGSVLNSQGSATSIFGYSGEETDSTGLVYLRARYMSPRLGMFLSRDPWSGDVVRPGSINGWNYTDGSPVNRTDPNGTCVFCDGGDAVKVDTRVNNMPTELAVRARPDPNAPEVSRVRDNQRVRIADSQPTSWGRDGWRRVFIPVSEDGRPSMQAGWIPNLNLLDNCDGPAGTFGCLPVTGHTWTQGFGPNQNAQNWCGGDQGLESPDCEDTYSNLRGLHNGLDFGPTAGQSLVWMGTGEATVLATNPYPGDASVPANLVVRFEPMSRYVLFGHISISYLPINGNQTIRSGQTIGEAGNDHLHLGVRSGISMHYNPVPYFRPELQTQLISIMGGYPEPYGPYYLASFDAEAANGANFWGNCPDCEGITFFGLNEPEGECP